MPRDITSAIDAGNDPTENVDRDGGAPKGLTRLRWLAIVLPLIFLAGLYHLLHTQLAAFHDFPMALIALGALALGIAAFSYAVFAIVRRLEQRIVERNAMLAALVAIGREASSSLKLDELLDKSLRAILELTSAEAAEVWLTENDEELIQAHHRGASPEAFHERTRLRMGEGLPGLAAKQGSPIIVHDLLSDRRVQRESLKDHGFQSFCALPLTHGDETHGVLCVAAREPEALRDEAEQGLLEGVAVRLALAIENSRLHELVLDTAVLRERERIARELHDGLAQVLGYINTQTLAVRKLMSSSRYDQAEKELEAMEQSAKRVYADVREGIFSLRTPVGENLSLPDAVRTHMQSIREMPGAPATLEVVENGETPDLPLSVEIQVVRIVQEALNNARNHAGADRVEVKFVSDGDQFLVTVADDGKGFRPQQRARTGWPHFGLQTMRERAEAIGAGFEIDSEIGRGTTVRVRIPLGANGEGPRLGSMVGEAR